MRLSQNTENWEIADGSRNIVCEENKRYNDEWITNSNEEAVIQEADKNHKWIEKLEVYGQYLRRRDTLENLLITEDKWNIWMAWWNTKENNNKLT